MVMVSSGKLVIRSLVVWWTYLRNMAVPVLLIVRAIAFQDLVILKICHTLSGILGSCSSLLKSFISSALPRATVAASFELDDCPAWC